MKLLLFLLLLPLAILADLANSILSPRFNFDFDRVCPLMQVKKLSNSIAK